MFLFATELRERSAEIIQTKIIFAIGAFDTIEKRGELDELVPRIEKIEIQNL